MRVECRGQPITVATAIQSFFALGVAFSLASATTPGFDIAATLPSKDSAMASLSALFLEGAAVAFVRFPTRWIVAPEKAILSQSS